MRDCAHRVTPSFSKENPSLPLSCSQAADHAPTPLFLRALQEIYHKRFGRNFSMICDACLTKYAAISIHIMSFRFTVYRCFLNRPFSPPRHIKRHLLSVTGIPPPPDRKKSVFPQAPAASLPCRRRFSVPLFLHRCSLRIFVILTKYLQFILRQKIPPPQDCSGG